MILLTWVGLGVVEWRDLAPGVWVVEQHISPYLRGKLSSIPPTDDSWPVFAATPAFLALSKDERKIVAKRFFEKNIRPLEKSYFFGGPGLFEGWVVRTSQMGPSEAPIEYFIGGERRIPYRKFDPPPISVQPRLSYVFFNREVLFLTGIISFGAIVVMIVSAILIRWIYRGFAGR